MIRANVAIRSLLYTAGKNPDESDVMIGFHEEGNIKYPTKRLSDCGLPNENWIMGDDHNRVFYTSPANSTVIDDINYMLPFSGTQEEGPVFLRMGRYQKEKEFRLISLREFFYKSKDEQVERLFLNDVDSFEETKQPRRPRSWDDEGNQIYNFISGVGNKIISYQYSPMVASDDKKIVNSPVHTYDFRTGKFHIVFGDNTAEGVINKMENLAEAGLYNFVEHKDKAQILLNLNQTKKQSVSINNVFLPNYFETDDQFNPVNFFSFYARNEMMKDALFLNEAISFNVIGLTIRAPGRFIFIDSLDSTDYDEFQDRFLGQWMIIKVVHTFKQNSYTSNVVATKVDAHSKIWEKEDTKF
jgi:Zn/Cd-binding protein ZinT